jgi:hypothetical protein
MNEEKKNASKILVGKPERKRPLGTPKRIWADNIGEFTPCKKY